MKRKENMLLRTKEFITVHPLVPENPQATAQIAILDASITTIGTLASGQDLGLGEFMGATDDRQRIAGELRVVLRGISAVAKVLDEELYPGVKAQFRLTGTGTYKGLLNRAGAFIEAIGPVKAAFVAHGEPADFDETLASLVAGLTLATTRKYTGLHAQMNGTAGMEVAAKKGIKAVRVLDSILSLKLKDNPALLSVWKAAQRIERDPVRAASDVPAGPQVAPAGKVRRRKPRPVVPANGLTTASPQPEVAVASAA